MIARSLGLTILCAHHACAFPPAPPSTIFGKVRGEFGFSPADGQTEILLLANDKVVSRTKVSDRGAFGENYRLTLPMDLNPSRGAYRLVALTPSANVTYRFAAERNGVQIPISKVETVEVAATPEAASVKELNFVLGEDSDADGLPDSWERFQASLLSGYDGDPLDLFTATGDYDGDGLSDVGEYIAGTFALIFEDGLNFEVTKVYESGRADLRFLAIDGKTYRIESTSDFQTWAPVVFTFPNDPVTTASVFQSENTNLQTVVAEPAPAGAKVFYRLQVD